jgi:multicomponent Na+:H+ antiporter subunit D
MATAIALQLLPRRPLVSRVLAFAGALAILASAALLLVRVGGEGIQVLQVGGWPAPFGITLVADEFSALMTVMVGIIGTAVTATAFSGVDPRREATGYHALVHVLLMGVSGAFLTGDLFNLYVWFEVMLIASFVLMALHRTPAQLQAAFIYVALNLLASALLLTAIGLLYGQAGTLNLADLARAWPERRTAGLDAALGMLFLTAFGIKAALFPLFFWLPASYHTAPISVTAALAGLLTKVGFYACLRVLVVVFGLSGTAIVPGIPQLAALLATATMIVSVLVAIAQVDLRRLLAFHILAQVAYLMMGLALASSVGLSAAIVYMMHTMLVQTGLFLGAGAIARAQGSYDLRLGAGLMRDHPLFTALFAVMALSLSGVPPLSGFWAKFLVIDAAFRSGAAWLAVVALIVGFLTMYSMSTVWSDAFWGTTSRRRRVIRPIPPAMMFAMILLGACTIGIGLAFDTVFTYANDAALQLTRTTSVGMTR